MAKRNPNQRPNPMDVRIKNKFPVLFLSIDSPNDEGYAEGYRYRVDQLDNDRHYFRDRDRAEDFIDREGMEVVSIKRMFALRDKLGIPRTID